MKINKILLAYAPLPLSNDERCVQPLGISYLHSNLMKNGYDVDSIDANNNNKKTTEDIIKRIIDNDYDFLGFSVLEANFESTIEIVREVKKVKPQIPICFGGVYPTIEHGYILENYPLVDFIIRGEGEEVLLELLNFLNRNGRLDVQGCSYRFDGDIVLSDHLRIVSDLDTLPFPVRDNYKNYGKMFLNNKYHDILTVSSSRGCPYRCTFCSVASLNIKWRGRSAENVAEEVYLEFKRNNDIYLVFIDDNFFVDPKRSLEIVRGIVSKCGKTIPFSFATRTDQVLRANEEIFLELSELGCRAIELGLENGSDTMLQRMNKLITAEGNLRALNLLRKFDIEIAVDYILYDNKTTVNELYENLEFFKKSDLFGYYTPLIYNQMYPYKGTAFAKQNIDLNNYFNDSTVGKIYSAVNKYGGIVQPRINKIIKDISIMKSKGSDCSTFDMDLIYLYNDPYLFFNDVLSKLSVLNVYNYQDYIDNSLLIIEGIEDRLEGEINYGK